MSIPDKTAVAGMVGFESDSPRDNAVSPNEKSALTFPVSVPLRAGEEIRTADVQLGNTPPIPPARRAFHPVKRAV